MYDPEKSSMAKRASIYGDTIARGAPRILIYGEFGVGKTLLAGQWPAPLFLDCDLGENKYLSDHQIPNLSYKDGSTIYEMMTADLRAAIAGRDMFDPEGGPYADRKTVVLDSWSKLNEMVIDQVLVEDHVEVTDEKAAWDHYMRALARQRIISKLAKQLSMTRGITFIATALSVIEGSEEEKLKREKEDASVKAGFSRIVGWPDLVGKYRYKIGAEFTDVWYYEQDQRTGVRTLWTRPHNGFKAKSRLDLPGKIENPTYEIIAGLMAKAKPRDPKDQASA